MECKTIGVKKIVNKVNFQCSNVAGKLIWKSLSNNKNASPSNLKKWPQEFDRCIPNMPWKIGQDMYGKLVYLSCGPDAKLHPQDNAPIINQKNGLPSDLSSKSKSGSINSKNLPKELDSCVPNSPWKIGKERFGTLVYLSCGPDGHLHPQDNAPKIDQATGQPLKSGAKDFLLKPNIPLDFKNDINLKILANAIAQVANFKSTSSAPNFVVFADPAFNSDVKNNAVVSIKSELNSFADEFKNIKTFYLVLATTKHFAKDSYQSISTSENDSSVMAPNGMVMQGLNSVLSDPNSDSLRNGAITSGHPNQHYGLVSIYVPAPIDIGDLYQDSAFAAPGEAKHALFYSLTNGQQLAPCFLTPGNLGIFGAAFGHPDWALEEKTLYLMSFQGSLKNSYGTDLYKSLDISTLDGNSLAPMSGSECGIKGDYVIAPIATAYLISKYGLNKEFDFLNLFNSNPNNWNQEFQEIYGESVSQFAQEVKPYLQWYVEFFHSRFD